MEYNEEKHNEEIRSKFYNGDMMSLTNKEIHESLTRIMWQHFLVQAQNISVNTEITHYGGTTKIIIEGDIYLDPENMTAVHDEQHNDENEENLED